VTASARIAIRTTAWAAAAAIVVLGAHVLVYALAPHPSLIGTRLEYAAGGPRLVTLTVGALVIAGSVAGALVWFASMGVAERARLELLASEIPSISPVRVAANALVLWCATSTAFALFESYLHWRAGLGWHGIHCLVGPVHRNAIPILAGLSLLASALVAVVQHLVSWARRVIAAFRAARSRLRRATDALRRPDEASPLRSRQRAAGLGARAPPVSPMHARRPVGPSHPTTRRTRTMNGERNRKSILALCGATLAGLVLTGGAWAHAIVSPPVAKSKALQQFTLSVPTEKENLTTTKVELVVPQGFAIDSFEPAPDGWKQQVQSTGSGDAAVIQKVTWTGGTVPTGQDAVFRFNASTSGSKTYTFDVRQTYSDGSLVDWNGPESSDNPAPRVEGIGSFGGGTSVLSIVALVVGALGLLVGGLALVGGRRSLT
jgi:uncharacterized protein YcnI